MCYILNLFRPIIKHEQEYDQFTKNEQLLVRKQYVLGNDENIERRTLGPIWKNLVLNSGFDADIEGSIQSFDV